MCYAFNGCTLTLLLAFRKSEIKFCNPLACDAMMTLIIYDWSEKAYVYLYIDFRVSICCRSVVFDQLMTRMNSDKEG